MLKFVFLDIDDVLLPWNFSNRNELTKVSGFDDWRKVRHAHMNFVSYDLLNYVNDKLGKHVFWLTTWELMGEGANKLFCGPLDIPMYKQIPDINYIPDELYWWKSSTLVNYFSRLSEPWRAVWIDDEIAKYTRSHIHPSLLENPHLKLISPNPVLSKTQVDEAYDWLHTP